MTSFITGISEERTGSEKCYIALGWQRAGLASSRQTLFSFMTSFRRLFILLFALNNVLLAGLKNVGFESAGKIQFIVEVASDLIMWSTSTTNGFTLTSNGRK